MRAPLILSAFALPALAAFATPAFADSRGFPVGGFDRVASSGPWSVVIHTGRGPAVRAEGARETLDRLKIEVVGGELRIGSKPGHWFSWGWSEHGRTMIDVTVPMIAGLTVSGPGDVSVDRIRAPRFAARLSGPGDIRIAAIDTHELTIDLSGPGNIAVDGRAGRAAIDLSGPGDVRAKGLTVGDADLRLSGPGTIALTAFGTVGGALSGPGDIVVGGRPHCTIARSGPGSVRCG